MVAANKFSASRDLQCEARGRDLIRRIKHRGEDYYSCRVAIEDAEERGLLVMGELAEDTGVGEHAEPARADERGADERGWQRREEEEAVGDEVVVLQRGHKRCRSVRLATIFVVFDREPKFMWEKMVTLSMEVCWNPHLGFRLCGLRIRGRRIRYGAE